MENFVKTSVNFENGQITNVFASRSLVLVNANTQAVYNVIAKCRNNDVKSVTKSMAKAVLAALRTANELNATEAAKKSKKRVANPMSQALGAHELYVTDKDGKVLSDSGFKVIDEGKALRDVFRFTKGQPVYQLVVEQGKQWDDPSVSIALNWWVTAAIEQLNPGAKFDEAFKKAADSTEAEYKAAESAKKTEKKASSKAA